ncbi:MAG: hypothetical protein C0596_10970 [Marinilabiliales bacterium]|nr:MAG: hypothetical protein C0596_10970 [Marinilabiliales bacterium]
MFLEGILAIAGQPGLFKLVSKGKNNVIVESMTTGKRMPAFATSRISTLEDVAIYTYDEDIPLKDVFISIFEQFEGEKILQNKPTNDDYKEFMESVLPDFDRDRVYVSDIKKVVNWFNTLIDFEIITSENIKEDAKEEKSEEQEDTKE